MTIRHSARTHLAARHHRVHFLAMGCAVLLLTSCASQQPAKPQVQPMPAPSVVAAARPDGSVRFDTGEEQVARLWAAAEEARRAGQDAAAMELLYDALELEPQNALLWSRAAELQLDNLESAMAENYATKSNAFAGNNNTLMYRNWLIIEHARNMRGDLLGTKSAHKKVQEYQYR